MVLRAAKESRMQTWGRGCGKVLGRLLVAMVAFQLTAVLLVFPLPNTQHDVSMLLAEAMQSKAAQKSVSGIQDAESHGGTPHRETTQSAPVLSKQRALVKEHRPTGEEIKAFEAKLPLIGGGKDLRYAKCNPSNKCLVHLHIGKNGGTSVDKIGGEIRKERAYVGGKHFDWSFIQGRIGMEKVDVILMLRDPVKRSLSHFYFTQQVYGSPKIKSATLAQFLKDPGFLLEERGIWQDGQAAVSWLTGTHIANWCAVPKSQVSLREELSTPSPELLHLAADRLEQTVWFGIIEDLPRSMELLQHALGLAKRPVFPHTNKGRKKPEPPTQEELTLLEYLMPMDRWLYTYGQSLFEARWEAYQQNSTTVVLPERPPYPEIPCWSTRFQLICDRGPLKGNFTWTPPPPPPPNPPPVRKKREPRKKNT